MEMEDQYGISDLRQFISRAGAQFPPYPPPPPQQPPPPDLFSAAHHHHHHRGLTPPPVAVAAGAQQHYDMVGLGRHVDPSGADMYHHQQDQFNSDSTTTTATAAATNSGGFDGGDGGSARWPRQETLTLLEIRSRLDHKFKEANQKGPLWDEVARIMLEEHGYQRSGKKCREKFENLYKYYKKTKEGKAGRQDGKHYRFFRQLEALYGDHHQPHSHPTSTHIDGNTPHFHNNLIPTQPNNNLSPSLSNSSDFNTSSSDDDEELNNNSHGEPKKKKNWKMKIKEFIDLQMRNIMEKQEAWLEKMMKTLENKEQERMIREEEWRKQEANRVEREHKFWASERAWIEARESALMNALEKITSNNSQWPEPEVAGLIQLRSSMESRFQQCGFSEEVLWEDISAKMGYLGYERSAIMCKEKWETINKFFQEKNIIKEEGKKKRKENYGLVGVINHNHNHNEGWLYMNQQLGGLNNCEINEPKLQLNEGCSSSPSSHNSNVNVSPVGGGNNVINDSCLRFFLGDGENNYGVKLNKGRTSSVLWNGHHEEVYASN